ncbi:hypothetical protein PoB_006481100 [Plakobranchus ocellatus]|uniref:Uncharacterized protein n=1 Tax=Plakobranchus ocellatus TaxID=259542 RepID=A0AAV4D2B5_9GAST|nr:hypothetical protein PoB_006481100 [Plakobranchus ocellatus]
MRPTSAVLAPIFATLDSTLRRRMTSSMSDASCGEKEAFTTVVLKAALCCAWPPISVTLVVLFYDIQILHEGVTCKRLCRGFLALRSKHL